MGQQSIAGLVLTFTASGFVSSRRAIASTGALGVAAGATAVMASAANGAVLTGADMPEYVFADALEASGAAGNLVEVLLRR